MARKLKNFETPTRKGGRKPTYPWDKWFNGSTWELTQGHDFHSTIDSMQKFIRQVASNKGFHISVFKTAPDRLVIQPAS